ncbi:polysaccharide deacetylase family protein (plasmid) [Halobaculum sp. CBA1158]|uniref:polysaccharide deacetylase family protein n=1 Tax=Halobaculum sp. CBA1158 TaxID=2904243 RepID=UPI001F1990D8|nr:polysaccharide deacetylase family protein [Halobaculum sp. CBA1158]UIP01530.1 polysaccharide deacetylase family protein [Halobaculum sp. CBA1158]
MSRDRDPDRAGDARDDRDADASNASSASPSSPPPPPPGNDDLTWPDGEPPVERPVPDDHEFVLLLTHDLDRPYKTYQSLYYALTEPGRRLHHLSTLAPGSNPYWCFDRLRSLEAELGVRSAWYVLDEQRLLRDRPPSEWLSMESIQLYAGRYDPTAPDVREALRALAAGGWEVGLHGSYESFDDRERLAAEKATVEDVIGHPIAGGRQHYLNLRTPETWEHHRAIGLRYDASLGSSDAAGFDHGHGIRRPFGDEFVVFPLTVMEQSLPDPGESFEAAWEVCSRLLAEAREEGAVMSVLWHPRLFAPAEFPGHTRLYRTLIRRAQELGAWVGAPGHFYDLMALDEPSTDAGDDAVDAVDAE